MKIVFDKKKLEQLLNDYYNLTGVRIAILDTTLNGIYVYPHHNCKFCEIIREDNKLLNLCTCSDFNAFKLCENSKDIYIYKCHAGLVEATAPIKDIDDNVVGYIMIGQITDNTSKEIQWLNISKILEIFDVDLSILKNAFFDLPSFNDNQIYSLARIMQACAAYIWTDELARIQRSSLADRIEYYISSNLSEELSILSISEALNIGKTLLCETTKINFNMTVVELITIKRLKKAKELLVCSDCTISNISEQVGIKDYNYFSRIFKKSIGISPSKYRKENSHFVR